ncbi:hypothetical protein PTKIN_Ptkin15bG0167500 [Pterospermum kingtungense]
MNRSQLCFLLVILLLFTPRTQAIRSNNVVASNPSAKGTRKPDQQQQVFHPGSSGSNFTGQYFEEKRRVPTGSNPLHNKR